jgi:hypothetical protein
LGSHRHSFGFSIIPLPFTIIPTQARIRENGALSWIPAKNLRE